MKTSLEVERLASTFYSPTSTCGCTSDNEKAFIVKCYGLDLGTVYNKLTCYTYDDENNEISPCVQKCVDFGSGQVECSQYPHGRPSRVLLRACAKLVVFKNAKIINGEFLYDDPPTILFSRQREDLPRFPNCSIVNPLHCPAENTSLSCTKTCTEPILGGGELVKVSTFKTGGQYQNVTHNQIPTTTPSCTGCNGWAPLTLEEGWKSNELYFGFSPCKFEQLSSVRGGCFQGFNGGQWDIELEENPSPISNAVLAGYAIDTGETWLLKEEATEEGEELVFPAIKQQIIENDPLGVFPHTVYLHYELKTTFIKCRTKPEGANKSGHQIGFLDTEKREKAVIVQAALGFSCQLCGLDPAQACGKLYPNTDE